MPRFSRKALRVWFSSVRHPLPVCKGPSNRTRRPDGTIPGVRSLGTPSVPFRLSAPYGVAPILSGSHPSGGGGDDYFSGFSRPYFRSQHRVAIDLDCFDRYVFEEGGKRSVAAFGAQHRL